MATTTEVSKAYLAEVAQRARMGLQRIRTEQAQMLSDAKAIVLACGGSFAIGYLHGRKGIMPTLFSVPYDALGGGVLILAALGGLAGNMRSEALFLGIGLASYYTGNLGAQFGQKMRKQTKDWKGVPYTEDEAKAAGGQVRTIVAGQLPPRGAVPAWGRQPQRAQTGY